MNMIGLRPYQKKAINLLYKWFTQHDGHPCLVLPTGSGKSHIIAELCKDALQNWPETRILMLTHVKELIEQDAAKLRQHWPNAPLGIYSAGIGKKEIGEPITFAGIQSIRNQEVGYIDLVIIDEAHLVSHKAEGVYRTFLGKLQEANPDIRVIGLTATPYRMGHGLITDGSAIFDDLIEPVTIEELQDQGYLADLRSKVVKKRTLEGGNTTRLKLFPGGSLNVGNAGSITDLISSPKRIVIGDEIDEWPDDLNGWGDPWTLLLKRLRTYPNAKAVAVSKPSVKGRSKIEAGYLSGDMRKFFVPCPHCGEYQVFLWSQMKWEKSPSGDREVWYECPYCKSKLKNYHKELMLKKGQWRPTNPNRVSKRVRSYQISSLYAPVGGPPGNHWSNSGSIPKAM
ncbi:MAG: phage terminase large subunit family protein [Sphaerochaetaceae bacterium]|jgi:hypothetical protein